MWERFFNWQSDMDWAWGPLLPLRPTRDAPMRPWVWVRLFLAFTLLGILLLGLLILACAMLPTLAARQHQSLSLPVSETIATLKVMVTDPATVTLLVGLALCLPLLFFTFCLPYHWAWNRRALRLKQAVPVAPPETPGVWPPAPQVRD